jgi:hypothetical protein
MDKILKLGDSECFVLSSETFRKCGTNNKHMDAFYAGQTLKNHSWKIFVAGNRVDSRQIQGVHHN